MSGARVATWLAGLLFAAAAPGQIAAAETDVLISAEAAAKTLNPNEISAAAAERIGKACVEYAASKGWDLAVIVLGPSGNIVYAYRMDGENPIEVDTAWRKAQTVLYMRSSTHAMIARYGQQMQPTMFELGQFPYTGGLPIMLGDQLIGAVGVGGAKGKEDEECAHQALEKVVGPQPPLIVD